MSVWKNGFLTMPTGKAKTEKRRSFHLCRALLVSFSCWRSLTAARPKNAICNNWNMSSECTSWNFTWIFCNLHRTKMIQTRTHPNFHLKLSRNGAECSRRYFRPSVYFSQERSYAFKLDSGLQLFDGQTRQRLSCVVTTARRSQGEAFRPENTNCQARWW